MGKFFGKECILHNIVLCIYELMEKNLTVGSIPKVLIAFSIPMILSALLQQLYQMVDIIIAGNLIGDYAIASIGATASIPFFIVNVLNGLTIGASIHMSNLYGSGTETHRNISQAMGSFTMFIALLSLLIAIIGTISCRSILIMFNTPNEIFEYARQYLTVIFIGIPFQALYGMFSAAMRAIGNSRSSLYAIIIAAVVNLLLDIALIRVFHLDVLGTALATIFAQFLSCAYLLLVIIKKHKVLHFSLTKEYIHMQAFRPCIHIGFPIAVQRSILTCGGVLTQNVINSFGETVISAITTAYRIDELAMLSVVNVGSAVTTFTAQNKGAGADRRVRNGFFIGILLSVGAAIITVAIIMSNCYSIIYLFGVSSQTADYAYSFLKMCSFFYPVYGLENACIGLLQGSGYTRFTVVAISIALIVRITVLYGAYLTIGFPVIAYSQMACWTVASMILLGRCVCKDILPRQKSLQKKDIDHN